MTIPTPTEITDSTASAAPTDETSTTPRDGWWRTNRLALVALLVLIPLVGVGVGWNEWYAYFGYGTRKVNAVTAPEKGTVSLSGATWGPIRSGEISEVSSLDMPRGTRLLAAIIPVDPDGKAVFCESPMLVQQSTGREWTPVRAEVGIPFDDAEPDHCISNLADPDDPNSSQPYSLAVAFVVPDDVSGPFWVEVDPRGDDRFARFAIDP